MHIDHTPPLVSIVMITYNRAGYILASIESILLQTYRNWELLVIDDGSTDKTPELVRNIHDHRIRYYRVQHCAKTGWLRHYGMDKSAGDYIAFNDSDDLWHPEKLEKQVNALIRNPEAAFCLVNGYNYAQTGKPLKYFYKEKRGERQGHLFLDCFRGLIPCFLQTLVFRSNCLQLPLKLYDERISDRNLIVSLAYHCQGIILYEPMVYRLLHEGNVNLTKWLRAYQYEIELIHSYRKDLPKPLFKEALYSTYLNFGDEFSKRGKRRIAAFQFCRAGLIKPFSIRAYLKLAKLIK